MTKNIVKKLSFAFIVALFFVFLFGCAKNNPVALKETETKKTLIARKTPVKEESIVSPEKITRLVGKLPEDQKQRFLQEMVDLTVQKQPGFAIQVEKYASEEVKKEMAQLRQEANVAQLLRQKNEISALKEQISFLSKENRKREELQQQVLRLEQEREQLKKLNDAFQQKLSVLESRVSALKKEQEDIRIAKEEKKVPVLLGCDVIDATFRITRKKTGEVFLYRVQNAWDGTKMVELSPGEYSFKVSEGASTSFTSSRDFIVSEKPIAVIPNPMLGGFSDIPSGEKIQVHAVVKPRRQ